MRRLREGSVAPKTMRGGAAPIMMGLLAGSATEGDGGAVANVGGAQSAESIGPRTACAAYLVTRVTGNTLEELVSKLSDMLLGSGFDNPYGMPYDNENPTQNITDNDAALFHDAAALHLLLDHLDPRRLLHHLLPLGVGLVVEHVGVAALLAEVDRERVARLGHATWSGHRDPVRGGLRRRAVSRARPDHRQAIGTDDELLRLTSG